MTENTGIRKIDGELLEKLKSAGIGIEEIQYESKYNDKKLVVEVAKFPSGRDFVDLRFDKQIDNRTLLESHFEHYKLMKDFEAIWSPKFKTIECQIEPTFRQILPSLIHHSRLARGLGQEWDDSRPFARYEMGTSESGTTISIGGASIEFSIILWARDRIPKFEFAKKRLTLKIENVEVSQHDKAQILLEKIGNSLLFKLDLSSGLGYKLAQNRDVKNRQIIKRKDLFELQKSFPTYEYDGEPMSLYWYAKSAADMPLLQFLALYQILEFYFPVFSEKSAHSKIKNIIKDPTFNANKDTDITKIITAIAQNKNSLGFGSEIEQLKATIQDCVTVDELHEYIIGNSDIFEYFKTKKYKGLSHKSLNLEARSSDLINDISERIYEIRCRVVHTKSSDKNLSLLVPSSPELKLLVYDISILEFIATKVLIATSRLLKI